MNHHNSGLAHGTNGSPQLTFEIFEMEQKVRENERKFEEEYKENNKEIENKLDNRKDEKGNLPSNSEVDFYGAENNKMVLPAKYKAWIGTNQRQNLLKQVSNPKLKNAISQLYRSNAFIGDGGTASALRF